MKIYVSGPYSADKEEDIIKNVNKAVDVGIKILRKGHTPFVPHTTYLMEQRPNGRFLKYDHYLWMDMKWLEECDAILHLDNSPGADKELERAKELGLKVYRSISEIEDMNQNYEWR